MLELIHKNNLPLDRIVHSKIKATKDIEADADEMVSFKAKANKIIFEKYGIEVESLEAPMTYEEGFYLKRTKRARPQNRGKIYGFPMVRGAWCNSRLKLSVLNQFKKDCYKQYIGYAIDEKSSKRQKKIQSYKDGDLNNNEMYPMVDFGATENEAALWCAQNNLLSPIYEESARGGCWFCHYQSLAQLRILRNSSPEKWELMLKWDNDSPVTFKPNGVTLHDLDTRFMYEELQISLFD